MIKKTLKNYLSNLKFVFTPIGILTIFFLIGLSILLTNALEAIKMMINDVSSMVSNLNFDLNAAKESAIHQVVDLDWKNFSETLSTILTKDWIINFLTNSGKAAISNPDEVVEQIKVAAEKCLGVLVLNIVILALFLIVGIILGYVVLKYIITRQTKQRKFWKSVLKSLLHTTLNVLIVGLLLFLFSLAKIGLLLNIIFTVLIFLIIDFFESFLLFGFKKVKFKKFVYWKNILMLALCGLIVTALTVGICVGCYYLFNIITAIVLIFGFALVGLVTNELLGENYITDLVNKETPPAQETEEDNSSKEEKEEK